MSVPGGFTENIRAALVALALFVFGWGYNALIGRIEECPHSEGFTSIYVVFGTAVTVAMIVPLIGWRDALIVAGAFVCSGIPMIVGSINRYLRRQERMINERRDLEERFLQEREA